MCAPSRKSARPSGGGVSLRDGKLSGRPMHAAVLRYFAAVARAGSIRKASEELHVASSAVSRQMQKLEEELGTPLFERLPNGLRLTQAGESLPSSTRARSRNSTSEGRARRAQGQEDRARPDRLARQPAGKFLPERSCLPSPASRRELPRPQRRSKPHLPPWWPKAPAISASPSTFPIPMTPSSSPMCPCR